MIKRKIAGPRALHNTSQQRYSSAACLSFLGEMFTGIVELVGSVVSVQEIDSSSSGGNGFSLRIKAPELLVDAHLGDSIAVDGVCLTITEFDSECFKVGISPETLRKTSLSTLAVGSRVNLERAMLATTRLGGHMVQGHVDTVVTLTNIELDPPNSKILTFVVPPGDYLSLIVKKGYVCLDGISLTVTNVDWIERQFSVMLIAYTQERVVLSSKLIGQSVNLEVDQTGKYIESQILNLLQNENSTVYKMVEQMIQQKLVNP
jgi:riboflavin synthase